MRKRFIWFIGGSLPRREAQVGTEAEAMQEHCLAPRGFLSLLYYTTLPRDSTAHGGFGPPMAITNQ